MSDIQQGTQRPDDPDHLRDAKRAVDRDNLVLGRELFVAFSSGKYKQDGYTSFDDYAVSLGIEPWRAKRLRRVFKRFSQDVGVPFDRMLSIGHERLKVIEPVITRGNREIWLKKAVELDYPSLVKEAKANKPQNRRRRVVKQDTGPKLTYQPEDVSALVETIKDEKLKPSTDGKEVSSDDVVFVKTIYLIGEQNTVFEAAIEDMERRTGSNKRGYLLTSALEEFLAHEATRGIKDDKRMRYFMNILERRYKGRLLWVEDKKVAAEMARMMEEAKERVQRAKEAQEDDPPN